MVSLSPMISVVLPVYQNNNDYLDLAINSILNQSLEEFELIIVANSCDNKIWEYLQTFEDDRIRLFRTTIGQIAFNLNYAVNISQSDLIARMDADDISNKDRLKIQYEYLLNNPHVDIIGSGVNIIDKNNIKVDKLLNPQSNKKIRASLPYKNPFCHPTVVIRKSTLLNHAGYLGGFYSEDYSLWLRLARDKDIIFENIQEYLLDYRITDSQTRGSKLAYAEVAGLLWTEFIYKPNINYLLGAIISSFKVLMASK